MIMKVSDWMFETPGVKPQGSPVYIYDWKGTGGLIARVAWDGPKDRDEVHSVFLDTPEGIRAVSEDDYDRPPMNLLYRETYKDSPIYFPATIEPGQSIFIPVGAIGLEWDRFDGHGGSGPEWAGYAVAWTRTSFDGSALRVEEYFHDPEHPPTFHRFYVFNQNGMVSMEIR